MTPEEIINAANGAKKYVIDCHQETGEGQFAFLAVTELEDGEISVFPLAIIAEVPPNPEYEIIGFLAWEGSPEAGKEWVTKNKPYLDKLNFNQS